MRSEVWAGRWEGLGRRWRKRRARGGSDSRLGARARAERTWNMYCMFVTLDVSRLSGWLNADAVCRVEREAWEEERHAGRAAGGRGATVAQAACLEDPTVEVAGRARARRTLNM